MSLTRPAPRTTAFTVASALEALTSLHEQLLIASQRTLRLPPPTDGALQRATQRALLLTSSAYLEAVTELTSLALASTRQADRACRTAQRAGATFAAQVAALALGGTPDLRGSAVPRSGAVGPPEGRPEADTSNRLRMIGQPVGAAERLLVSSGSLKAAQRALEVLQLGYPDLDFGLAFALQDMLSSLLGLVGRSPLGASNDSRGCLIRVA